jgi:TRAP-type C4-dicarboxylate transport system substrate-binding protein
LGAGGDRSSFVELGKLGVTVTELTDTEKAEFRKATSDVMAKWAPQVSAELVKKAQPRSRKRNAATVARD